MNKIKIVSRFFRILFQVTFIVLPISLMLYWVSAPEPLYILLHTIVVDLIPHGSMVPHDFPTFQNLTSTTKFLGFLTSLLPAGVILCICYFLIKLFRLYENNEIFSLNNIGYMRKVAYTLLIGELIILPIYQALLSLVLTWHNQPRFVIVTFNFGILLLSVLLILISWIMAEGHKLQEEQKYIV